MNLFLKCCFAIPLLLLSRIDLSAQNGFDLKLYQNTDFFESRFRYRDEVSTIKNRNFTRLSVAAEIRKKSGYAHQLEVFIPDLSRSAGNVSFPMQYEFRKTDEGDAGRVSAYSFRYELSKRLSREESPIHFILGVGLNPYYVETRIQPTPVHAAIDAKYHGAATNVIPRFCFHISKAISLDLSVPFKVYDFRREYVRIFNPSLPIRQQRVVDHKHILFEPSYTIRLGIAYRFQ